MKLFRIFATAAGVCLLAASASAQYTTFTASYIGGTITPEANGTIYLQPTGPARVDSWRGQMLAIPYQAPVSNGSVSISIPDALATNPTICYAITVIDNVSGQAVLGAGLNGSYVALGGPYGCVQPTGTSWSFDTYTPNSSAVTLQVVGPTGPAGPQGASAITGMSGDGLGDATLTGTFTDGALVSPLINSLQSPEFLNTAHPPLKFWDAVFHNCQNQVVNVFVHGDSRSINDTTVSPSYVGSSISVTFGNKWVDQLRTQLQSACGSAGTGLIPFRWGTGSLSAEGLNQDYYAGASGSLVATDTALGPFQPNTSDPMVVTATTNGTSIPFTPLQNFDHLVAYCVTGPGLNAWTMTVDSSTVGTCGGSGGSKVATRAVSSAVTNGPHTVSFSCATQPCEAYGLEATSGSTGVEVHNLSVGGGSAEIFGYAPTTQFAFSDLVPNGLALDIIYEISNEPGQGYSTGQFQTSLNNIFSHEISAHTYAPSFLIVSPLQDGISGQTSYYPILSATAAAQNAAFVDLRDRWGTALAPSYLFGPDGYHEDNQGNGEVYSAVAETLIDVVPQPRDMTISNPITNIGLLSYAEPGLNNFSLGAWGSGLPYGLPGVFGLWDSTVNHFVWSTNPTDDVYGYVPTTNVAAGTGAAWSISHTGNASFNLASAVFFKSSGTPTFSLGATGQVGTGATAPSCYTGWTCTNDKGFVSFVTGTGTLTAGVDFTITWSATAPDLRVCQFWFNTVSLNTSLGPELIGSTTSATTFGTTSALSASTTYYVFYSCR